MTKSINRESLAQIPTLLREAFDWDSTAQGWDYWEEVRVRLELILAEVKPRVYSSLVEARLDHLQAEIDDIRKQLS